MDNTPQPALPTCVGVKALERGGVISCWNNFRVIVRE